LRDDRVECYASDLRNGIYEYSYICRATISGTFLVSSAIVKEMYVPEIFASTSSEILKVVSSSSSSSE
jgi:uncharacterized protein YfaS (alpha-2-macroglobulin family)